MNWRVVLERDEETSDWAAWCPELPGCTSAGETETEALQSIREAIQLYLEPEPIKLAEGASVCQVTV
ncbi:MAG TPA: type II toxin-antitoxin system HicB family antitoxin [Armatimonadota bacterium]